MLSAVELEISKVHCEQAKTSRSSRDHWSTISFTLARSTCYKCFSAGDHPGSIVLKISVVDQILRKNLL